MHGSPRRLDVAPWLVEGAQCLAVPAPPFPHDPRVHRRGGLGIAGPPLGLVMTDRHRLVAPTAMNDAEVSQLWHCQMATAQSIDHDLAPGIDCTDCADGSPYQGSMILTRQTVLANLRRLVQQIEAQHISGDPLI